MQRLLPAALLAGAQRDPVSGAPDGWLLLGWCYQNQQHLEGEGQRDWGSEPFLGMEAERFTGVVAVVRGSTGNCGIDGEKQATP